MNTIRWLHISDLHYNKIGTQTEAMRDKLPDYIKEIVQERNIDYVFFTGDARYAPDKDFPDGIKRYFSDICEAAHIDQDRLFIVMGNHDIDRTNTERLEAIETTEATYTANDGVISPKTIKSLKQGRDEYNALLSEILPAERYCHHAASNELHYVVTTDHLNIVHVDSTITYREHNEKDLLIGSYELRKALKKCDSRKPTIILSHYSFECFSAIERDAILSLLKQYNVQLWLAGHEHHIITYKDRDYFYVAHSGNQTFEKNTTPSFVEGCLDTNSGIGYFTVHFWVSNQDWAVYPTLAHNRNGNRSRYFFVLDSWLSQNNKYVSQNPETVMRLREYLSSYQGNTFLQESVKKELQMDNAECDKALNDLKELGIISQISVRFNQWKIEQGGK